MDEAEKRRVIRDAATVILLREHKGRDQVLMGQRGSGAVFMPNKYVFPGGAVDAADYTIEPARPLAPPEAVKLAKQAPEGAGVAAAMAAVRELWEETGLMLGIKGQGPEAPPADWRGFFERGLRPRADVFRFVFRAVTPPGRPRRFDARFFMADVGAVHGSAEDFSGASDELSHLHWIDLDEAKSLDLPFITEVVLSEVLAIRADPAAPRRTPFFHHDEVRSHFSLL